MGIALAAVHLLALGVGLGAIWGRARSFGAVPDTSIVIVMVVLAVTMARGYD